MDFTELFGLWTALFTIGFCLMPIGLCFDWKNRGTSDGFSSFGFVFALLMMLCWLRFGIIAHDPFQIYLNTAVIVLFSVVLSVFAYYQSNRSTIRNQLLATMLVYAAVHLYVDSLPDHDHRVHVMGTIAATIQTLSLSGLLYEIYRVLVPLKTTEYLPAGMTFGGLLLALHFAFLGLLTNDVYMIISNVPGIFVNLVIIGLYYAFPPRTWVVPLIGTGTTQKTQHLD